jgi:hypothetical protein
VISVGVPTPILFASQAGDYATFKFQPHLLRYPARSRSLQVETIALYYLLDSSHDLIRKVCTLRDHA